MKFGLCVVGCGNFGQVFARSLQPLLDEVDLYFASRDRARAEDYAGRFRGQGAFGSYSEAAHDDRVQALYVCTPHYLHMEHAELAAAAGKHILLEKPISIDLESGGRIISAAAAARVNLMIAENYRFVPAVRLCKRLIDEGRIGKIRIMQAQQETPYRLADWRQDSDQNGGGVFIDAGIHKVHLLRYLAGEPSQLFAAAPTGLGLTNGSEDGAALVARWDTGEVGFIMHSWSPSKLTEIHWVSVLGTEGRIFFNVREPRLILERGDSQEVFDLPEPPNGILPMVGEFLASIREARPPEVTGEEGLKDLELVLKAYQSMEQGTSLSLA